MNCAACLAGKVVLDMGCDVQGVLIKSIIEELQPKFVYGVNPGIFKKEKTDQYQLLKQDGANTTIDANSRCMFLFSRI